MIITSCSCLLALSLVFSTASCANNGTADAAINKGDTTRPVETKEANTKYDPAFAGQTRVNAVKTSTPYKVEKLASSLGRPWAVIPMPDGRLLITEKSGFMQLYTAAGALVKKITGFPEVDDSGQGGLLDVALDPAFTTNKMIYWSFSEKYGFGNLMAVAKGQLNEAAGTVDNAVVIFRATPALKSSLHFGC
ncbi:MAG: PQQ-dependent sugar dehydrogenase, partial [Chitinophagaceae bacterium]